MGQQRRQSVATRRSRLGAALRRAATFVVVAAVITGAVAARQAVVMLHDGQRLEGELVEQTDQSVTFLIAGMPQTIERDRIADIDVSETFEQEYARRAAAAADDPAARYRLAHWLFEQQAYTEAEHELNVLFDDLEVTRRTAEVDADLAERAAVLATAIEQRIKLLQQEEATRSAGPGRRAAGAAAEPGRRGRLLQESRLTAAAINRIRLMEIDPAARPNVRVHRDVWNDLFTRYADHPLTPRGRAEQTRMRAAEGWRQLQLIFDLGAREYYDQVQVLDDPPAMRTFRTQIHHRYVLNYCGTAECHGGTFDGRSSRPGGFELLRLLPNRDDTVYTNFHRLHATRRDDGEMLDREKPAWSLLIQYGLPRDRAYTPHPDTPGWRFGLRDENDAMYQVLEQWIARELYHPTPDYGIEPPGPAEAGQPTVE